MTFLSNFRPWQQNTPNVIKMRNLTFHQKTSKTQAAEARMHKNRIETVRLEVSGRLNENLLGETWTARGNQERVEDVERSAGVEVSTEVEESAAVSIVLTTRKSTTKKTIEVQKSITK